MPEESSCKRKETSPTSTDRVEPAEEALVFAALKGDLDAFGHLHARYARIVHALCYDTAASFNETEDMAQEVFLRAFRNLRQLRDPEKFGSWLLGITHRVRQDWRRRRARDRHQYVADAPDMPRDRANEQEDTSMPQLRQAISQLGEQERTALHLFYLEELSAEQARNLLALSKSGFYRVLQRAREQLRSVLCLDEEGDR